MLLICADLMAFANNADRFDALIISAEIGYEKPSREIFEAALSMSLCFVLLIIVMNNLI
jgi:hypothetical protein